MTQVALVPLVLAVVDIDCGSNSICISDDSFVVAVAVDVGGTTSLLDKIYLVWKTTWPTLSVSCLLTTVGIFSEWTLVPLSSARSDVA